eukprot:4552405-Amphidinium_carterae.1
MSVVWSTVRCSVMYGVPSIVECHLAGYFGVGSHPADNLPTPRSRWQTAMPPRHQLELQRQKQRAVAREDESF